MRTAEKWGDMAVLNYPDQWKGGRGGTHHCKERTQIVKNETKESWEKDNVKEATVEFQTKFFASPLRSVQVMMTIVYFPMA